MRLQVTQKMSLRFSIAADKEPAIVGGWLLYRAFSISTTSVGNGTTLMDRLDSLASETGYPSLGRHAEYNKHLSATVVRAKAKMSEKVVRHEFQFVEN